MGWEVGGGGVKGSKSVFFPVRSANTKSTFLSVHQLLETVTGNHNTTGQRAGSLEELSQREQTRVSQHSNWKPQHDRAESWVA